MHRIQNTSCSDPDPFDCLSYFMRLESRRRPHKVAMIHLIGCRQAYLPYVEFFCFFFFLKWVELFYEELKVAVEVDDVHLRRYVRTYIQLIIDNVECS